MQEYAITKTASSWDSFRESLEKVLKNFDILSVLEYGPGESTKIMQESNTISLIDSIEHNEAWGAKHKESFGYKVKLKIEQDEFKYPYVQGRCDKYSLIFIDGKARVNCLMLAPFRLKNDGIVFLHDAERPEYKKAIETFEFKFFADNGHTCILTNHASTAIKLSEILW